MIILSFINSNGELDVNAMLAFFQKAIDWGISAGKAYLVFFAGVSLILYAFKS